MAEQIDGREFLIVPTQTELSDAWQQYRGIVARRYQRGQSSTDPDGQARVSGMVNADQILADNPHLAANIDEIGAAVAHNIEEGRITPADAFRLGARHILEMFSIATTAYQIERLDRDL
jgi:hypothetical protein